MLYQQDDIDVDDEWLTADEQLPCRRKVSELILQKVKGE